MLMISPTDIINYKRICFVANEHPVLFLEHLRTYLKAMVLVEYIDVRDITPELLIIKLEVSFLGIYPFYIIQYLNELSSTRFDAICKVLLRYQGFSNICIVLNPTLVDQSTFIGEWKKINLIDPLNRDTIIALLSWYTIVITPRIEEYIDMLLKKYRKLYVEDISRVAIYMPVVALPAGDFVAMMDNIIINPESLFNVSQFFFQGKIVLFYEQWQHFRMRFSPQFWTSFWLDQLFNAALVVHYRGKVALHDQRILKLPFSFFKNDWKRYTVKELTCAYNAMFTIDYQLKNGGTPEVLELFYAQFFSGCFK